MYIHVSYYMLPINVDHREVYIRKGGSICNDEFLFHCFTEHFNSLNFIHQLMHFY